MSRWGMLAALIGVALLGGVLYQTNLGEVGRHLARLSMLEVVALVSIYLVGRLGGVVSWLLTMNVAVGPTWFLRLLRVHLIGCAVERVTPLAGMGGEPVKLAILKREYGLGLREVTASLALTRITDLAAILLFCGLGLATASSVAGGDSPLREPALGAVAFLVVAAASVFAVQRMRLVARGAPWLRRRLSGRALALAEAVVDIESKVVDAYGRRPGRLWLSVAATFFEWVLEALLVWTCLRFLELPVSVPAAISIAAFALAVRTAFFFVPADIGTQEAALVAICQAIVAAPGIGLAIAAVIRLGEALWTVCGIAVGFPYLIGKPEPDPAK